MNTTMILASGKDALGCDDDAEMLFGFGDDECASEERWEDDLSRREHQFYQILLRLVQDSALFDLGKRDRFMSQVKQVVEDGEDVTLPARSGDLDACTNSRQEQFVGLGLASVSRFVEGVVSEQLFGSVPPLPPRALGGSQAHQVLVGPLPYLCRGLVRIVRSESSMLKGPGRSLRISLSSSIGVFKLNLEQLGSKPIRLLRRLPM